MQKVFISWCGADRDFKNAVYARLRSALDKSVDIWESDEHCISNFSEECIRNIRESSVFVLLLSAAAQNSSSYVINEVIEAHGLEGQGKLNMVVYNIDSCPLTDKFAMQINHISDANHVKHMRGGEDNVDVLIDRVKILLQRRAQGNPEKPLWVNEPKLVGVPIAHNNYYVEGSRNATLEELHEALQSGNVAFVNEISGYGRKSVAKVYASQHKDEYDVALELHTYCGSVRDFFANGIQFENVSDEAYANLDEKRVILKKIELLDQLVKQSGKRILLLASYLNVIKSDFDDFIMSCIKALPVKVIFVTENIPHEFSSRFATVNVGKMDDCYLETLFFHYVDMDENDKRIVEPSVTEFFNSVGGHTAAVELTAKTIADEFGLEAQDIADALNKITPNTDNDLSQRIYAAYSNLFSLSQFDEKQLKILSLLSIVMDRPVAEKFIVELLKNVDLYDGATLKKLCDLGWIKRDTSAKTLEIEAIIANVCLAANVTDKALLARCLSFLFDRLDENRDFIGETAITFLFAAKIYRYLNAPSHAAICDMSYKFISALELRRVDFDGLDEITSAMETEAVMLGEQFEDAADSLMFYVNLFDQIIESSGDDEIINRLDIAQNFFRAQQEMIKDMFADNDEDDEANDGEYVEADGEYVDSDEDDETVAGLQMLFERLKSVNDRSSVDDLIELFELLAKYKTSIFEAMEDDSDYFDEFSVGVGVYCVQAIVLAGKIGNSIPEGLPKLRLCQAQARFVDAYEEKLGKSLTYNIHAALFRQMIAVSCEPTELKKELDFCLNMLSRYKSALFATRAQYDTENAAMLANKAHVLIKLNQTDEAAKALTEFASCNCIPSSGASSVVAIADEILGRLSKEGKLRTVTDLIKAVFTPALVKSLVDEGESAQGELTLANGYLDIVNADIDTITEQSDFDDCKYTDYYQKFGLETCDKRTYASYEAICNEAGNLDLSAYTQQQMLDAVAALKKQAALGADWKTLAAEAFALVSEAGYRVLGYRHHWVQYFGACCMLDGNIAQILNGEGKTYTILLVAFVLNLYCKRVDILDCLEHLCRRNYNWMGYVLRYLGLKVRLLVTGDDYKQKDDYDIGYALSWRTMLRLCSAELDGRDHRILGDVAIVDEADVVMIEDRTRRATIINGVALAGDTALCNAVYFAMNKIADNTDEYFEVDSRGYIDIKEKLYGLVDDLCAGLASDGSSISGDIKDALRTAVYVFYKFKRDKDYHIQNGKVYVENRATGVLSECEKGYYYYFIARKENLYADAKAYEQLLKKTQIENYCNFIDLYERYSFVCGTTATAMSMKAEFDTFYGKKVICVPPNKPVARTDHKPTVFSGKQLKDKAIVEAIKQMHDTGRPVLAIAANMYELETYSAMLKAEGVEHALLSGKNALDEERILSNCGRYGAVTLATAIANRGVDIALGGSASFMTKQALLNAGATDESISLALSGDGSPISKSIALRYSTLLAENTADVAANRQRVVALGGLAVICTACFDDLRIEQQARGRCGRQGQPGDSYQYMSLDDDLLKRALGNLTAIFANADIKMQSALLNKSIGRIRNVMQQRKYEDSSKYLAESFTSPYRDKIIGLSCKLKQGKTSYEQTFNEFVLNDGFIKRWTRGNLSDVERNIVTALLGKDYVAPAKRIEAEQALKTALNQRVEGQLLGVKNANYVLGKMLETEWGKFFNDVWAKYKQLINEHGQSAAANKKAREYAEEAYTQAMLTAIYKTCSAKVKVAPKA